jgi:PleD family two-component response regulator
VARSAGVVGQARIERPLVDKLWIFYWNLIHPPSAPSAIASKFPRLLAPSILYHFCNMRILLVDDETDILSAVGRWLQQRGHRTVAISDSREVLGLMEIESFDLVCLDLLMPYVNGLQLISEIHKRQPTATF